MSSKLDKFKILLLIIVISSIIGFIYEEIFYYIDLGYFIKRGSGFGPWVPIYGYGSLFIVLITNKFKNNKILTTLFCFLIPALLELFAGYILYTYFNTRLWDYNIEIINYGNIGGYICLRSVLLFGIGGLFLVYKIVPFLEKMSLKIPKKIFNLSYVIGFIFFIDVIFNYLIKQSWR